jgi:hypothetical protein
MAQSANSSLSGRELALERRKAMSSGGKAALGNAAPQAAASAPSATVAPRRAAAVPSSTSASGGAREASLARRKALSKSGKSAVTGVSRSRTAADVNKSKKAAPFASPEKVSNEGGCGCGCGGKKEECKAQIASKPARSRKRI